MTASGSSFTATDQIDTYRTYPFAEHDEVYVDFTNNAFIVLTDVILA